MRCFQPTYSDNGKSRKSKNWHVAFKQGKTWRRLIAYADKSGSESLGRKCDALAALFANRDPLTPDLARWIDGLDDERRGKLIEWGLIDAKASQSARPLLDHIEEWRTDILNRNPGSIWHADLLHARVSKLFTGCGFVRYSDIDATKVNDYIARQGEKMSVQTGNHYKRAAKQGQAG